MGCIERFMERSACACDFRKSGWMAVCRTPHMLHEQREEAALASQHGYTCEVVPGSALRRSSPCFRQDVVGAVHWVDSAICDPRSYMKGLERACQSLHVGFVRGEVAQVVVDTDGCACGVSMRGGQRIPASHVVIAGGVWSKPLIESLGWRCPLVGARGYNIRLEGMGSLPETACVLSETSIAATPTGHDLRLAGTLEIGALGRPWIQSRLTQLRRGASAYLDGGLGSAHIVEEWAGYRPALPDGMPAVGALPGVEGVFVGTGHAMLGMTLGPIAGRSLARMICGDEPEVDLSLMRPDRFGQR